jgi:hypothetical protein
MAQKIKVFGTPAYLKIYKAPRFKKAFGIMKTLPWDKDYGQGIKAGSAAQLVVWRRFMEVAHETRGLPLSERLKVISQRLATGPGSVAAEVYRTTVEEYMRRKIERRRQSPESIRKKIAALEELARAKAATATY